MMYTLVEENVHHPDEEDKSPIVHGHQTWRLFGKRGLLTDSV